MARKQCVFSAQKAAKGNFFLKLWLQFLLELREHPGLLILLFIIQSTIHEKFMKYILENFRFSTIMGFQNANENEFYGCGNLVTLLWKSFGNLCKDVCTNPVNVWHDFVYPLCKICYPFEYVLLLKEYVSVCSMK